jgi:prepilin-type N-terminal cleavage/methylation domain-containing protein
MKKGFSLIELVVAMGIFAVISTLVVGAFVTVTRMKALTSTMNENQQKTRIVIEMITRLSRQAEKVVVSPAPEGKIIDLYFNTENPIETQGVRFQIKDNDLLYSDCSGSLNCVGSNEVSIYRDVSLENNSFFKKVGSTPPTLEVSLFGKIKNPSEYYSDEINLTTKIILERIR